MCAACLNADADKVSFNTAAVANPQIIRDASDKYGAQCIVVAIDAKKRVVSADLAAKGPGWDFYTHGGRKSMHLDAVAWATQMAQLGAGEILLTGVNRAFLGAPVQEKTPRLDGRGVRCSPFDRAIS